MPDMIDGTMFPEEFRGKSSPQPSKDMKDELDEILSQAFTDGASDTMWQNDRHIEIFATAKQAITAWHLQKCRSYLPEKKDYMTRRHETKWDPQACGIWNEAIDAITKRIEEDVWMQTTPTNTRKEK